MGPKENKKLFIFIPPATTRREREMGRSKKIKFFILYG
jgi:hypothetical protein